MTLGTTIGSDVHPAEHQFTACDEAMSVSADTDANHPLCFCAFLWLLFQQCLRSHEILSGRDLNISGTPFNHRDSPSELFDQRALVRQCRIVYIGSLISFP